MSSQPVVSARYVSKMFSLYIQQGDRVKQAILSPFGKKFSHDFWALKDVNFDVFPGEAFGIIGRNGSGKSTLLQIVAGVMKPTKGWVDTKGRMIALLELGSGFSPEFTGRENIFLSGAILGLSDREMKNRVDAIIDFASIGEYIDQPVKLYSTGMFVRLAFATAVSVDPDILLIDETLAVGDIFFRQKCYARLNELLAGGTSIILVSHAMNEVEQFCSRAILLKQGIVSFSGSAIEAVKKYYQSEKGFEEPGAGAEAAAEETAPEGVTFSWPSPHAFLDISRVDQVSEGSATCTGVAVTDLGGRPCQAFSQGETAVFFFEYRVLKDIPVPVGGVEIVNERGLIVHGKNGLMFDTWHPATARAGDVIRFRQEIRLDVAPGEYTFNLGLVIIRGDYYNQRSELSHPDLDGHMQHVSNLPQVGQISVGYRHVGARPIQLLHYGAADLPGKMEVSVRRGTESETGNSAPVSGR